MRRGVLGGCRVPRWLQVAQQATPFGAPRLKASLSLRVSGALPATYCAAVQPHQSSTVHLHESHFARKSGHHVTDYGCLSYHTMAVCRTKQWLSVVPNNGCLSYQTMAVCRTKQWLCVLPNNPIVHLRNVPRSVVSGAISFVRTRLFAIVAGVWFVPWRSHIEATTANPTLMTALIFGGIAPLGRSRHT